MAVARKPEAARSEVKERIRARQAFWLAEVLRITGRKASPLAEASGVSSNLLTRFQNSEESLLDTLTIELVKDHTGLPGPDDEDGQIVGLGREEGVLLEPADMKRVTEDIRGALQQLMSGHGSARAWMLQSRSIEAAGWMKGDIVVVDPAVQPWAGDAVVVTHDDGRLPVPSILFRVFQPPYLMGWGRGLMGEMHMSNCQPVYVDSKRRIIDAANDHWQAQQHIGREKTDDRRVVSGWRDLGAPTAREVALARAEAA